ncbi:MAG: hypothetical protein Ct9H90mP30_4430 [Actinomycetota bacterium]|nr:MAG: hypothetical protein Ct9H90mP30_4430 [Actinomycetota bacterium]
MTSISTNDFKNGWTLMVDSNLMQIVEFLTCEARERASIR